MKCASCLGGRGYGRRRPDAPSRLAATGDHRSGDRLPALRLAWAPHLWLDPGRTISTLDLFNTGELTLLTAEPEAWQAAATAAVDNGIPVRVQELRAPAWPGSYEVEPHGAVLVPPRRVCCGPLARRTATRAARPRRGPGRHPASSVI